MDKNIFPQMIEISMPQGKASYEKKCLFHEKLLYRYLERKIEGWSVNDFLNVEEIQSYALYAISDFTALFLKDLKQTDGKNRAGIICDRNAGAYPFGFGGWTVIEPDELMDRYKMGEVRKIIVMSVLHENEIIDELLKRDVLLKDMISFVSVLFS